METIEKIALFLVIVGGLNWGLIGFLNFNLVSFVTMQNAMLSNLIYILVGLSAILSIPILFKDIRNKKEA